MIKSLWPAVLTALILAVLPLVALTLIPSPLSILGFFLSHYYYSGAQILFGKFLFPNGQFGCYPANSQAMAMASGFYAAIGFVLTSMLMFRFSRRSIEGSSGMLNEGRLPTCENLPVD